MVVLLESLSVDLLVDWWADSLVDQREHQMAVRMVVRMVDQWGVKRVVHSVGLTAEKLVDVMD